MPPFDFCPFNVFHPIPSNENHRNPQENDGIFDGMQNHGKLHHIDIKRLIRILPNTLKFYLAYFFEICARSQYSA
jgi:hypothetical protein